MSLEPPLPECGPHFWNAPGKTLYPLGPDIEISGRDMVAVADQLVAMPQ
jgi:hypothetical protein